MLEEVSPVKVTVSVAGLAETKAAMQSLTKATGRRQMRDALLAAGEITAKAARALAPVDEGWLREGINVSTMLTRTQAAMHVKRSEVEVFIGPKGSSKSIVQEFGSVDQPPQSYMRPAWDMTHRAVLDRVADEVMVRVDAAIARAAKKAARAG